MFTYLALQIQVVSTVLFGPMGLCPFTSTLPTGPFNAMQRTIDTEKLGDFMSKREKAGEALAWKMF